MVHSERIDMLDLSRVEHGVQVEYNGHNLYVHVDGVTRLRVLTTGVRVDVDAGDTLTSYMNGRQIEK